MFSGCMNTSTLQDLSIVEGLAVDEQGEEVELTVQTLNFSKEGDTGALTGNITQNTTETGHNISLAISKLSKKLAKQLFFEQNKIIVFGRELAEKGIEDDLDYFVRNADSRIDVALCVSDSLAKDIVESKENDALVPCENIVNLLKNGEKKGYGSYVTLNEILNLYAHETSDVFLPVVKSEEDSVEIVGVGIFNDNKLVDVLDDEETFGFLLMKNRIKDGLIIMRNEEFGGLGAEIVSIRTKVSAAVENNQVVFNVKISTSAILDEVQYGLEKQIDNEVKKKLETETEKKLIELCEKAYYACLKNNSDVFRVGEYLCKSDKACYEQVKDNWDETFQNSVIKIEAKCKLRKVSDNSVKRK